MQKEDQNQEPQAVFHNLGRSGILPPRQSIGTVRHCLVPGKNNWLSHHAGDGYPGCLVAPDPHRTLCRRAGGSLEPETSHARCRCRHRGRNAVAGCIVLAEPGSGMVDLCVVIGARNRCRFPLAGHDSLDHHDGAPETPGAGGRVEPELCPVLPPSSFHRSERWRLKRCPCKAYW